MEAHHQHHDRPPDDWPPFLPVSSSPPVARMELAMLPASLARWLCDVAERQDVPLEFVVVPALVSASALIGRRVGVAPKEHDDWTEIPNLYGLVVATSGAGKSPAEGEAFAPYRAIAEAAERDHVGEGPPPRYLAGDATVEALGVRMSEIKDGRALLVVRSELAGLLGSFRRQGREGDRAFYLEAWMGDEWHRVDRIGRDLVRVRLCLALYGGIQPGALVRHVAGAKDGGSEADGLLQRFGLAVYPDPLRTYQPSDRTPDVAAREQTDRAFGRLARLEAGRLGAREASPGKVPSLRFAPDAQGMFIEWHDAQALRVRRNDARHSDAFISHLSKHRGLVPSLALIFHLLDLEAERSAGIDRLSTARAIAMVQCLEHHAAKIYGEGHHRASQGAVTLAEMIVDGEIREGANVRDVYRRQRAGIRGRSEALAAAHELEGRGWLRLEHGERRSLVIRLRPTCSNASSGSACETRGGGRSNPPPRAHARPHQRREIHDGHPLGDHERLGGANVATIGGHLEQRERGHLGPCLEPRGEPHGCSVVQLHHLTLGHGEDAHGMRHGPARPGELGGPASARVHHEARQRGHALGHGGAEFGGSGLVVPERSVVILVGCGM